MATGGTGQAQERGCPGPGSAGAPAEGPQPFDWVGRLVWV